MELRGKRILVTGGSDGIGRHICLKLAETGARLAILGRDETRLQAVAEACEAAGGAEAVGLTCDLQDLRRSTRPPRRWWTVLAAWTS